MRSINSAFFILILLITGPAFSQTSLARYIEIAELVKKEYNVKNYKVVYTLFEKNFQKELTEKQFGDFLQVNVRDYYGEILEIKGAELKDSMCFFVVQLQKGQLDLVLGCNKAGKLNTMQWLPHKVRTSLSKKNESYLSDNPKKSAWDLKVDSIVKNFMLNADNCGLSIAIINNNETLYYNYGETKKGNGQLPNTQTIYEIGSVSKTFTGILLAKAVQDKKVNLNDDIRKYLPEGFNNLAYNGKPIELLHLANHTSRLPRVPNNMEAQPDYDAKNPYKNYNRGMVYNFLRTLMIDTFPGTKSEYSNLGMALLGIILEKVYAKPYEELVVDFITRPLFMTGTRVNTPEAQKKDLATGYDSNGNETEHWDLGDMAPAGGIRSTSGDMAKYVKANLDESDPGIRLSHSSTFNDGRNHTALAWHFLITKKGNEVIWHNGGTYGFTSFCAFLRSKNSGVIVLNNSANPVDFIGLSILKLLQ